MRRKCILLGPIFLIIILMGCGSVEQDKEKDITEYLSDKYNQNFEIISNVDEMNMSENVLYEYSVSPQNNMEIVFYAGQKKSQNKIFPFAPPIKEKVFFDDFFDKSKEYIIENQKKEFVIDDANDVTQCAFEIYNMMSNINNELSELGFSVTKYTPSLSVKIIVNGNMQEIEFYIMDKSVIYDLLNKAYGK